ncbi:conserved hypothetical protein [Theileria orientalis strain Shintoku]|uniref:Amino acid transporter n=1 Tax=Theileria orientalis strain Shintoku TaxID=869250 RepID=J4C8W1_THEOR|nr:conserved hypothetical protein [Theileria orientalis strain Shintoku]BAM41478.1 conserved hypothetical protein [Theileria orientalis strain Shintoku]|eukprot:XP_009691779.1 conserved hypothetical protein [Theileria orientalis strain Shintoku]
MGPPAGTNANPGMNNAGSVNSGQEGADRTRYVRSRKRFKVYTWKYKKTITPIASFILLVNQIFGFGMNSIPSVIAEGGLLRVFLANLATCIIACICSLMLLKSMTFIPHNSNFQQRIEYNTLVKYYLSDFYFKIISFLHYIGDFCTIVCGIITFSKLVDMLFIKAFGFTLALQVYPRLTMGRVGPDLFVYIYETTDPSRPFGVVCITLGYLICTLICTKLSCSSLEETTHFHVTSFLILLGCSVQLCVYSSLKAAGSLGAGAKVGRKGFLEILLTFVDNYSLASTLPSWANEMTNQVNPTQTIWLSSLFAFFIYLVLGMLFSKTFSTLGSTSILDDILNSSYNFFVNCSISLFVIVTSIPDVVFGCISLRYNLLNLGYLNSNYSYFWGCVFPFMFTWLLVNDKLFQNWLGNLGLISALICDFFVPVLLYTVAYSRDYSDFTKLRRTSKLQIVSGWLHSRLGYLYSTSGTMYNRLNTVYNSLLSAVSGSGSSGKSLPRRGTKGHQANVPEGLEKGESSTTISSASDSTYSRGDSGASTSSTDTASVLERGVSGMARPHYGVDRSGSKESTTSASRKDTGNFRTFSAFLSRDSFMSNRLFRAGNRLFTGTNRLLGTTFSKSISLGSFGRSFSSILNRRGTGFTNTTDTGFTKSGTKETTTSEVDGEGGKVGEADKVGESRTRVSRFNTLSGKFTKSISFTFGNKFSMVSHRLSSRFTNRLTTSGSATGTNSINTSLSKQLSKGLSTSLSETLNKSLGASLTTGLRNTSSISRNLRKTISQNISKSFSKNFVSTTEVMLGDGTIDRSHEAEGTSDGSSSSSSSIEGAYVASSAEGPPTATGTRTGNVQGLTKKVTRRTECESHSGSGRTVATVDGHPDLTQDKPDRPGSGDHTHEVALSEEPRSSVDYRSFKIIRNSNDFRKTHDDLFNAVNRPSKIVVPDTPGEGSPHNPFFAPATAGASDAAPSGARGLTRSETSAKDQNRGHSSGGKRDKHGSGASKERVVVFPRPLHRYHLAIAKVMMVSISMLTLVVPGLHFLVVSD